MLKTAFIGLFAQRNIHVYVHEHAVLKGVLLRFLKFLNFLRSLWRLYFDFVVLCSSFCSPFVILLSFFCHFTTNFIFITNATDPNVTALLLSIYV